MFRFNIKIEEVIITYTYTTRYHLLLYIGSHIICLWVGIIFAWITGAMILVLFGIILSFIIAFGLDDEMDHFAAYLYLKFSLKVKLEYEEIKKLIIHR